MKYGFQKIVGWMAAGFCLYAQSAIAAPRDSFGVDADAVSRAMAVTASASAASAAATNPARLIAASGIEMTFDMTVAGDQLKINDAGSGQDLYLGYQLGVATPLPLGRFRDRLFAGLDLHVPGDGLYQVHNSAVGEPVVLHTGSDARHFSLDAALAVRIWNNISIGGGIYLMPCVKAGVNIDFSGKNESSSSTVVVDYRVAPVIGLYAQPVEGLQLGFSYRGAVRLDLDVPAEINVSEEIGAIHVRLLGAAFAEPHRFSLGVRYDFSSLVSSNFARFAAEIDAEYMKYADPIATSADVILYGEQGQELDSTGVEWMKFGDAWSLRAALTWMPLDELSVSAGYAFEKSPVPAQRSVFNVLDADRNQISFGATYWLPKSWLGSFDIGFSAAAKFDLYADRNMEKYEFIPGNAGFPAMHFRGFAYAWHGAIMLRFE